MNLIYKDVNFINLSHIDLKVKLFYQSTFFLRNIKSWCDFLLVIVSRIIKCNNNRLEHKSSEMSLNFQEPERLPIFFMRLIIPT